MRCSGDRSAVRTSACRTAVSASICLCRIAHRLPGLDLRLRGLLSKLRPRTVPNPRAGGLVVDFAQQFTVCTSLSRALPHSASWPRCQPAQQAKRRRSGSQEPLHVKATAAIILVSYGAVPVSAGGSTVARHGDYVEGGQHLDRCLQHWPCSNCLRRISWKCHLRSASVAGLGYRSRYCARAIRITSEREVCVLATYCSRRASKVSGRRTCLALECTPGAVRDGRPRRIRARA